MKVIIFSGKSGSGKTFAGEIVSSYVKKLNQKVVQTNYSKYLKLYAKELFAWNGSDEEKPRTFLQDAGMIVRSMYGEDFLGKRMLEDISFYEKFVDVVVICDGRMPLEMDIIKKHYDTRIIRIDNTCENKLDETQRNHVTETAMDAYQGFDVIIENHYDERFKEEIEKEIGEFINDKSK